jgi:asparagine synthase (glutamine-hydrolysing)
MICGIFGKDSHAPAEPALLCSMLGKTNVAAAHNIVCHGAVALGSLDATAPAGAEGHPHATRTARQSLLCVWQGEIYNRGELWQSLGMPWHTGQTLRSDEVFLTLYAHGGLAGIEQINGRFAFALYDTEQHTVVLGRDHFGLETLYYYEDARRVVFSSRLAPILAHPEVQTALNVEAMRRFLVFNYNPAWDTFFCGIKKLRPGHVAILGQDGMTERRYWQLSFQQHGRKSIPEYCHDLVALLQDAIRIRTQGAEPLGIFLSGGLDSSSVAGLTRALVQQPFATFSYRCLGKSFDESHYARLMARACGAEHHEVVYNPTDICHIESIVPLMDEPFCNVGINIATYLLGQAAQGKASRIFSGDGGDEIFGGHPVYCADKIAAAFDRLPCVARLPLTALVRYLPDSDQKLNLTVKLKRFAESLRYPSALGTHRWRIYYDREELKSLLHPDLMAPDDDLASLCSDLLALAAEADGPDMLSRSLYVDMYTELDFSLRRMDLIRSFHMTLCFPFLDYRLVAYAATIPSPLKIRRLWYTKYIQHSAMAGVLPEAIVHRKDKLGLSIPFKNWLRCEPAVQRFVQEVLFTGRLQHNGIINSAYVRTLWEDHQHYRRNNAHRLWALTVLELWLGDRHL